MAYSDFNLERAVDELGLTLGPRSDLLARVEAAAISPLMRIVLEQWAPLAFEVNTEKARSEMVICPILLEAVSLAGNGLGVYSGVSLDVDRDLGLFGRCDFLIGRRAGPFLMGSPLLAVVEAKNDGIAGNLGQCVAETVAARLLNDRKGHPEPTIHGAVTTGREWMFLRLDGSTVTFDSRDRDLDDVGTILAYLAGIMSTPAPSPGR